jgi:hypothetical protein
MTLLFRSTITRLTRIKGKERMLPDVEQIFFVDANDSIKKKSSMEVMTKKETTHICHGVPLKLPPGVSPYASYPFLLHDKLTLPWSIRISDSKLTCQSNHCSGKATAHACYECQALLKNDLLNGILHRIHSSVHANTPLAYQPLGGLVELIHQKNEKLDNLRLMKLTFLRRLVARTTT